MPRDATIDSEAIAQQYQRALRGSADVADHAQHQCVQFIHIE